MMFRKIAALGAVAMFALTTAASAAVVNVDLSGASTGSIVNGIGADFGASFVGQTEVGNDYSGLPSSPLTLVGASPSITVAFFNPGVSAASNSLLSQDNGFTNAGLLSGLLDSAATSITMTAGFFNGGAFDIDFFAADGSLVGSDSAGHASGYHVITFNVGSAFNGFTIHNNTDAAGLRFQNFSYEEVGVIPLPAGAVLLVSGLVGLGALRRRRAAAT